MLRSSYSSAIRMMHRVPVHQVVAVRQRDIRAAARKLAREASVARHPSRTGSPAASMAAMDAQTATESLTGMTVPQLKATAKARGLSRYSDLNKAGLIALLTKEA